MPGDESDSAGQRAVGKRNPRTSGRSHRSRYAGDNLVRHTGIAKCLRFLAPAAEDEGVASFEANNAAPVPGRLNLNF